MRLRHIHPQELHAWWPRVRDDLDACRVQSTDDVWMEDVYSAIQGNRAWLYVAEDERNPYLGCLVLEVCAEPFSQKRHLHVWMANGGRNDILVEGAPLVEDIARQAGLGEIRFRANRLGFERLAKKAGYKVGYFEMLKRI